MSTFEIVLRLFTGAVLVALNALFVLTEFALTRARSLGKEAFEETASLRRAWAMTEELEIYLTGCQLGISTTSVLLGVLAEPGITALLRPLGEAVGLAGNTLSVTSVVVAVVLMNLVHKIWGEQAPTYFGVEEPVLAARVGATFLYLWTRALMPLVMAGDGLAKATLALFGIEVTRSWVEGDGEDGGEAAVGKGEGSSYGELRRTFDELMVERRIPVDRRREVLGTLDLDVIPTSDIMVPREEVIALDRGASFDATVEQIAATKKTRYPVEAEGELVGTVYTPALFDVLDGLRSGEADLSDVMVEAVRVSPDLAVGALIDTLQERRQELALVVADGEVLGIVTVTDALETIAGDLQDPHDACA